MALGAGTYCIGQVASTTLSGENRLDPLNFDVSLAAWIAMVAVTLLASIVKGAIGFAMPMIMISGLANVLPPAVALAVLIVPTLLANLWQAGRFGPTEIVAAARGHLRYLLVVLVVIALSAQLVTSLTPGAFFLVLGLPIVGFGTLQLSGWRPRVPARRRGLADLGIGAFAGLAGGLSGVWGPPTVLYLMAIEAPKRTAILTQGIVYSAGSVVLLLSHLRSGILNGSTLPLSLAMVLPMLAGMWLGQKLQDRFDQNQFRRWTLIVLVIAGINLIRRGVGDMM